MPHERHRCLTSLSATPHSPRRAACRAARHRPFRPRPAAAAARGRRLRPRRRSTGAQPGRRRAALRLQRERRVVRPDQPDGDPLRARRPRVRRREERPDQGFDSLERPHADRLRRPRGRRSTTSGTAGCSGSRSTRVPDGARTSTCSTRTTRPDSAARRRAGATACPTPPGATGDGCVVSGRLSRLTRHGHRAGADRGLVPAVPEPLASARWPSAPTARSTSAAATARASTSSTTARTAARVNPCGDPPGGAGGAMTPPTAEGGALRSQDLRTSGDPTGLDGTILRVNPGHRRARCPTTRNAGERRRRTPAGSSRTGLRNPFRFDRPARARASSGSATSAGTTGRRSTASRPRGRGVDELRLAVLRGRAREPATTTSTSTSARRSTRRAPARHAAPYYAYQHTPKVVPGETCPTGSSSISGLAFYNGGTFPAAYDGALFFSDYSRNCIWVMFPGADGLPDPATRQTFVAGGRGSGGPRGRARRRPLLRRPQRRHDPPDPLLAEPRARPRVATATPDERRGAAERRLRRHAGRATPTRGHAQLRLGPRRRRRVRRLDRRRRRRFTLHRRRYRTPCACG